MVEVRYYDTFKWSLSYAAFSDDDEHRYRYRLLRRWDAAKPAVAFCMLNPSTADASTNDPTVERCERRARNWGYGALIVVNLFGFRSTDPRELYKQADPVGPENIESIAWAAKSSAMFVCGWGTHGAHCGMGETILGRLRDFCPGRAQALKVNVDGSPAHPLYLPYTLKPMPLS